MEVLRKIYPQQLKDAALQPGNNDDYFGKFGVSKYKGHKQINFNKKINKSHIFLIWETFLKKQ